LNPKVRELITQLHKRWRRAQSEERRARIAELLNEDCTIRGLAEDLGQPESVIRYYSKSAPDASKRKKTKAPRSSIPVEAGSKQVTIAPNDKKQTPLASKQQVETRQPPLPISHRPGIILPPQPTKSPANAASADQAEKEESLRSLERRLPEVIIEFIRTKLGTPDTPAKIAEIKDLLGCFRAYSRARLTGPRQLPDPVKVSQLYQLTRPNFSEDQLSPCALGSWLSVLVLSLDPGGLSWDREIEEVEQRFFPPPEQADSEAAIDSSVDEFGRRLKPYELRLRAWGRDFG
jgi:hypothetical protein